MKLRALFTLVVATAFAVSACGSEPMVVASFSSILTEVAEQVGGNHIVVEGLVKAGVDPHEYEPKPSDLKVVSGSRLILTSGKHLEQYLNKLSEATGGNATLLQVGDSLPSLQLRSETGGEDAILDPHWWHSVANVKQATKVVRDALIKLDLAHKDAFEKNAEAYQAKLNELEGWVKRKVAELPRDKRKLVTSHDAFQYFARDYGFTILAVEGLSTETEPSNRHVSELIDTVKKQGVKAIFLESTLNPKVTQEITRETGAKIGGTLDADGLGPDDRGTYAGMMKHNVSTIVDALK